MKRQFRNNKGEFCTALEWKNEQSSYTAFPEYTPGHKYASKRLEEMKAAKPTLLSLAEMAVFGLPNTRLSASWDISVSFGDDSTRISANTHMQTFVPESIMRAVKDAVDARIAKQQKLVDMLNANEVEVPDNY